MSEITFIGLGLMGASLARALFRHGVDLTVWNRSPAELEPFAKAGVSVENGLKAAIAASPVIVICIDNYPATRSPLEGDGIEAFWAGRSVVQLSTGTPKEAAEMAAYMASEGPLSRRSHPRWTC